MIILDATNEKIQFYLGGAITTNKLHAFSAWSDKTSTTSTPGSTYTESNNTTDVDLVGSPAASTQRVIIALGITNRDTAAATATVQWTDGVTDIILVTVALAVGDTLQYVKDSGWSVLDANGKIKSTAGGGIADGDTLSTGLTFPNGGVHILDTNATHDLILKPGSNLTADRNLTLTTGDADRTLDISAGSVTVSAYGATLVDDADAAAARTTLGLGTMSTQASGAVSITGGSITGITDLAVADGGTGASTAATARAALGAANLTACWWFTWSGRILRGTATASGDHLNPTALSGTDSNLSDNSDPDGCLSGYNMADGIASDLHFQFPVPDYLDLTAVVTAEVYYRIGGAGTGAAVEIELYARNIDDDEVNASGGTLFSVSGGSCIKSVNSYASGDLVVHSLGTVFGANTLDAGSIVHGTVYRDALAGNTDDTLAQTVMMGAIKFTGTRLTT